MKRFLSSATDNTNGRRMEQTGRVRISLVVLICAALAAGVTWQYRMARRSETAPAPEPAPQLVNLSDSSKAVLGRLKSPVEVRFYSLLDAATVPVSVQTFAGRVDLLLSAFEREGSGRIKVTRYNSRPDIGAAEAAAATDGFKPFNLDKGDACYFGLAVSQDGRKESLPQLAPEWEPALELDLARAIQRVSTPPAQPVTAKSQDNLAMVEEVKRTVPNFTSLSLEEGTRLLHEAALKDFKEASAALELQVKAAQQRVTEAQNSGTAAEQQAALQQLQKAQMEGAEKLKQIAARSAAQIEALQQLKASTP